MNCCYLIILAFLLAGLSVREPIVQLVNPVTVLTSCNRVHTSSSMMKYMREKNKTSW